MNQFHDQVGRNFVECQGYFNLKSSKPLFFYNLRKQHGTYYYLAPISYVPSAFKCFDFS